MRVSRLLLLPLLLTLTTCSRGVEEVALPAGENATFIVSPLSAPAEESSADSTFRNVPTAKLLNFTACMKDVGALEPVNGAKFTVKNGDQPLALKSEFSDDKGCLYWSETFPYTATDQETYFEIERTVEALSIHKGKITVRLAVNPWKKGKEAVKDLRFESAPATIKSMSPLVTGDSALVIESVAASLEIVRSAEAAAEANLELGFEPRMRRLGIDGTPVIEPLTSGRFLVKAQLMAYTSDAAVPLTDVEELGGGAFQKSNVVVRKKVRILRKFPREARLELSFEAIPVDAPGALKSVRGMVSLGRISGLTIKQTSPLRLDQNLSFLTQLPAVATADKGVFGFEVIAVRSTDVVTKELDGTGQPKVLSVKMRACLRNSITQEKILGESGQHFRVQLDGKDFVDKTDDDEGCLKWDQDISFDFHGAEIPQKKTLVVQSVSPPGEKSFYGDQRVERTIYVNPWKYEAKNDVVADELYDGPPIESVVKENGSEMVIPSAFFNFMDRSFQIDDQLNLSTTRKFRFETNPKIRRLTRNKGWQILGSGNGRYLVHFLLETIDHDEPRVVDARTVEVESRADVITATVDFHVEDVRLVAARLNLSIEIVPIDRPASFISRPYIGTFDMLSGFAVRFEPRDGRIEERMKLSPNENHLPLPRAAELFAKAKKHQLLDEAALRALGTNGSDVERLYGGDKSVLAKLCGVFFDPKGWFSGYKGCVANPESQLVFAKTEHIKKIQQSALALLQASNVSMSAGVNYDTFESHDESSSRSQNKSYNSGVKLSVPVLQQLGLEIGMGVGVTDSWNTSTSYSKGSGTGRKKSADQSKSIYVDEADFNITADVERCVVVANKGEAKKPAVMACAPNAFTKRFQEQYFLLHQPTNSGPIIDSGAPVSERPFMALVRGRARFEAFKKVLEDPEANLNLAKPLGVPSDLMREAAKHYDGFFPGLLTLTE